MRMNFGAIDAFAGVEIGQLVHRVDRIVLGELRDEQLQVGAVDHAHLLGRVVGACKRQPLRTERCGHQLELHPCRQLLAQLLGDRRELRAMDAAVGEHLDDLHFARAAVALMRARAG